MTRGILDRENYYYRRLYVDAVRAVETAAEHERVDAGRIGVGGFSQGGALSLAVSALLPDRIRAVPGAHALPVRHPPRHHDRRRAALHRAGRVPREHNEHIPRVLDTLRYIDNAVLAPRIRATTTVSVGLMDACCPPSTVYAAYNAITAPKRMIEYAYCEHDLPGYHIEHELEEFARDRSARSGGCGRTQLDDPARRRDGGCRRRAATGPGDPLGLRPAEQVPLAHGRSQLGDEVQLRHRLDALRADQRAGVVGETRRTP